MVLVSASIRAMPSGVQAQMLPNPAAMPSQDPARQRDARLLGPGFRVKPDHCRILVVRRQDPQRVIEQGRPVRRSLDGDVEGCDFLEAHARRTAGGGDGRVRWRGQGRARRRERTLARGGRRTRCRDDDEDKQGAAGGRGVSIHASIVAARAAFAHGVSPGMATGVLPLSRPGEGRGVIARPGRRPRSASPRRRPGSFLPRSRARSRHAGAARASGAS